MNRQDLKIGNWYMWIANGKAYPYKVTIYTFDLADDVIANFVPIPISKEILSFNGFKTNGDDVEAFVRSTFNIDNGFSMFDTFAIINFKTGSSVISHQYKDDAGNVKQNEYKGTITSVDQLQNILRDVGSDIEIRITDEILSENFWMYQKN